MRVRNEKRHGVFWCKHCGYHCPAKVPVNELQRDLGHLDHRFWEIVRETLQDLS